MKYEQRVEVSDVLKIRDRMISIRDSLVPRTQATGTTTCMYMHVYVYMYTELYQFYRTQPFK